MRGGACRACASTAPQGIRQRTDVQRRRVVRRLAGEEPLVNEEWNCGRGPLGLHPYTRRRARPAHRPAGPGRRWGALPGLLAARPLAVAADGRFVEARATRTPNGRAREHNRQRPASPSKKKGDAYAEFAGVAFDTPDVDIRARAHSAKRRSRSSRPGSPNATSRSATRDLERAPAVLLAGLRTEAETPNESTIVFLPLRKAVRHRRLPPSSYPSRRWPAQGLASCCQCLLLALCRFRLLHLSATAKSARALLCEVPRTEL